MCTRRTRVVTRRKLRLPHLQDRIHPTIPGFLLCLLCHRRLGRSIRHQRLVSVYLHLLINTPLQNWVDPNRLGPMRLPQRIRGQHRNRGDLLLASPVRLGVGAPDQKVMGVIGVQGVGLRGPDRRSLRPGQDR